MDVCYEIHPGEDLFDGATFEMFLDRVKGHKRCNILYDPSHFVLQQLDYLAFIDIYHSRIRMFHAKDAEFNPTGRQGVYSGYQPWAGRAGRFRSLGDGQVDFGAVFSKLSQHGYDGWAVLEWECCIKDSEQGAAEGAPFIAGHIIPHRLARLRRLCRKRGGRRGQPRHAGPGLMRRIRLGMVGGGQGAFIGAVHRIAARLDDRYELVAGAFSADPPARAGQRRSACT